MMELLFAFMIGTASARELNWRWEEPPDIVMCRGDGINAKHLTEAKFYLQSLGWEFGEIGAGKCSPVFRMPGKVYVTTLDPDNEDNAGKAADAFVMGAGDTPKYGVVRIKPYAVDNYLLYVHELGHILGMPHNDESTGTPMCWHVDCMGWGTHLMWASEWDEANEDHE